MASHQLSGSVVKFHRHNLQIPVGNLEHIAAGVGEHGKGDVSRLGDAHVLGVGRVEVRDTIAERVVGIVVAGAVLAYVLHHLEGGGLRQGLPQTGAQSSGHRTGQAGAVGHVKPVARIDTGGAHAHGSDVGFHAPVVGGSARRETGHLAEDVRRPDCQHVIGIARMPDIMPFVGPVIASADADNHPLPRQQGSRK